MRKVSSTKLPFWLTASVIFLCSAPSVLTFLGVDFSSQLLPIDLESSGQPRIESLFHYFSGAFTHTILEWTAFCTALFTVILAFAHFAIKRDVITPVIGISLFCSGLMDGFHTLAADRLITGSAVSENFFPFTWAICRLFMSIILLFGAGMFLFVKKEVWGKKGPKFVLLISLVFGVLAYLVIYISATSQTLPVTVFPDAIITRPWDVYPLIIFAFSSIVFINLYKRFPSTFSHALLISTIPNIATQLHMVLGSSAIFDRHFNIAHFLKILAYMVPFAGLALHYIRTYKISESVLNQLKVEVSVRKRVEKQLEDRASQLKISEEIALAQSKYKSQFLANVSHEIRTPMNAIMGTAELLLLNKSRSESDIKQVKNIQMAGESLLNLIDGILDLSRVQSGQIKLENIKFELSKLLMDCENLVIIAANKSGLDLNFSTDFKIPIIIQGDFIRLRQILVNLIGNAIKFTKEGGVYIHISPSKDNKELIFTVRDTGIGIPGDQIENIFEKFSQADSSVTRNYGGTGLGLAITKEFVDLMNGSILVESTPGKGSLFTVSIPLQWSIKELTGPQHESFDGGDDNSGKTATENKISRLNQYFLATKSRPQILVVDDVEINRDLIVSFLEEVQCDVKTANNGNEAFGLFKNTDFDLVLMDIQMPVLDGYSATRQIREWEKYYKNKRIPIVALTAHALIEEIKKGIDAGCDSHVAKPIKRDVLIDTLVKHLGES